MQEIKCLIPYVSENFVTFPLWEEGDYRPHINIWQLYDKLPQEIINNEYITKIQFETYPFVILPKVKYIKESTTEFIDIKIKSGNYYKVEFEIYNGIDILDDDDSKDIGFTRLLFIAQSVIDYFKEKNTK
jgi:hypothetical protein